MTPQPMTMPMTMHPEEVVRVNADGEAQRQLLFVPVREGGLGMLTLRTGRLPSGRRVGLAFTSEASLRSVLGPGQRWIRLHENAVREMLTPAGIAEIRVDAGLRAAPAAAAGAAIVPLAAAA